MYDIIGDSVNTAKRICSEAGGGEILISRECYEKTGKIADVGSPLLLKVKGKSDPLRVYPLRGLKPGV
jgi:class 3 adenylate cyclase